MAIDKLMEIIESEFGTDILFTPKELYPAMQIPRISTGNIELDIQYGGGLASGRIHLISGPFSSGKTYLAMKVGACVTKKNQRVAFIDEEGGFDPVWASHCGLDMDYVFVGRGKYAEQTLDLAEVLIASGEFPLVVLDSIATLLPKSVKDEIMEKQHMGIEAKLVNKFLKKAVYQLNDIVRDTKANPPTVIVINQIRMKIGVMFGSPEILPHGEGQRHFSSTWIDFRAKETIQDKDDNVVGMVFSYNLKKNKTAPPRKTGQVSMFLEDYHGMKKGDWDYIEATLAIAEKMGIITKEGKMYVSPLWTGKKFYKHVWEQVRDDVALENKIVEEIKSKLPKMQLSYEISRPLTGGN